MNMESKVGVVCIKSTPLHIGRRDGEDGVEQDEV